MQDVAPVQEVVLVVQHYRPDPRGLLGCPLRQALAGQGQLVAVLQEDFGHLHLHPDRVAADRQLLFELLADYAQPALLKHLFRLLLLGEVDVRGAVEDAALGDVHLGCEVLGLEAWLFGEFEVGALEAQRTPAREVLLVAGVVLCALRLRLIFLVLGLLLKLSLWCLD